MTPCPAPLFDTHVHLTDPQFDADRAAVLERAAAAGVERLVEIGDSPDEWPRVLDFARRGGPAAGCALGLHPYYADRCTDEFLDRLGKEVSRPEVLAVGEVGLDYARGPLAPEVQRQALRRLLAACRAWDKPVVLHCRQAYGDLRALVKEAFPAPPADRRFWGVVHCFSGTPEDAEFFAAAGFAIGADGPVTYPKNDSLREAFRRVGPSAAVLETDSPYLPPQGRRGERNEPGAVADIAAVLAELWALELDATARATSQNAQDLFRL